MCSVLRPAILYAVHQTVNPQIPRGAAPREGTPQRTGLPGSLTRLVSSLGGRGEKEDARELLAKFKWGHSFLSLNGELLERYAACADGAEVIAAQEAWLVEAQIPVEDHSRDMPPSESESEYTDEEGEEEEEGEGLAQAAQSLAIS